MMFIKELLQLLSDNRRYPKYQHERRIDIFLNFFLPGILEYKFGNPIDLIIPEFPLKNPNSHLATNIDYLAYSVSPKTVYICEFKTDTRSFKKEQLERYRKAVRDGWNKILLDVQEIQKATSIAYQSKYDNLLQQARFVGEVESIQIVYIAPRDTNFGLDSTEDLKKIYVEDLATMDIKTDYPDEWRILRKCFKN